MHERIARCFLEVVYAGFTCELSGSGIAEQFTPAVERLILELQCKVKIVSEAKKLIVDRFAVSNRQYAFFCGRIHAGKKGESLPMPLRWRMTTILNSIMTLSSDLIIRLYASVGHGGQLL